MSKKEENTWKTLHSEVKFETPWIKVTKHDVLNPAGKPGIYGTVSFKNLAIGVLPLDKEGNTWLVGQWRYPLNSYSWEIPEGGGPHGVDPLLSAKRELKEETGLIAHKITEIGRLHTSNSEAEPEETEDLQLKKLPFEEAYHMVINGTITDSLSVIAILRTKILLQEGKI